MGGGNRFNANLASGRVRSTWTATFVPTIQAPGLHTKAALAGQRCRRNEPRLLGRTLAGTVRSKLLSGESYLVAVAPPTPAAAPATTISAVPAASSATAAAGTFRLRARLIDVDRASAD
jgi:hypothetical protein